MASAPGTNGPRSSEAAAWLAWIGGKGTKMSSRDENRARRPGKRASAFYVRDCRQGLSGGAGRCRQMYFDGHREWDPSFGLPLQVMLLTKAPW